MIIELSSEALHLHVKSSKSCNVDRFRCDLESINGRITFAFNYENLVKIEIIFRKISGNGRVLISGTNLSENYTIFSKVSQSVFIDCSGACELSLSRENNGLGVLQVLGVNLHINETLTGDDVPKNKWKQILFGMESKQLKSIDDLLFASVGSYILSDDISYIVTDPPNSYIVDGNKFKFTQQCEITEIVKGAFNSADTYIENDDMKNEKTIYDSNKHKFVNCKFNDPLLSKLMIGNDGSSYLSIKRFGSVSISNSGIKPNTNYLIILSGRKIGSSGETKIGIDNNIFNTNFDNFVVDKFIRVTTGRDPIGDAFKINILVTGGEITISRIRVIEEDNLFLAKEPKQDLVKEPKQDVKLCLSKGDNKKFVIVIPSYNNEKWANKNILSALNQNYNDFRIIYTDDLSPDNTFEKVKSIVDQHANKSKTTLIRNEVRVGALENLYNMIHSCSDDEIILTLDGDDWLSDENVLNKLNEVYKEDVWMTYGQYQNYPDKGIGIATKIPDNIINSNNFRQYHWCSSHLRTFYAWLFKNIKKEDLMYSGKFAQSAWDMFIMFPMLEMAGKHSKFISDILYIYNLENPINDHKVDRSLQQRLDRVSRSMKKYSPISIDEKKYSVGLLLIATGKYDRFLQQIIKSADKNFLANNRARVKYIIFTDSDVPITTYRDYEIIKIPHKPFPYASMDRFKHFTDNSNSLSKLDYLYYVDVDCTFVDSIEEEILGNLVGVRHCGYYNGTGTFEDNPNSVLYIDPSKYSYYFGGGFNGGKSENFLKMAKWCYDAIEKDLSNDIIPRYHDETALNRYFLDNVPDVILSPAYHHPQSNLQYYQKIWGKEKFKAKIMLLDKKHNEIRK